MSQHAPQLAAVNGVIYNHFAKLSFGGPVPGGRRFEPDRLVTRFKERSFCVSVFRGPGVERVRRRDLVSSEVLNFRGPFAMYSKRGFVRRDQVFCNVLQKGVCAEGPGLSNYSTLSHAGNTSEEIGNQAWWDCGSSHQA